MDVPVAPSSAEPVVVLLWVIGVLFVGALAVVRMLFVKIAENEARCAKENAEAKTEARAAFAKVVELQGGVIIDQARTQVACNVAMGEMADATRALAEEIRVARMRREKKDEESDVHRVVGRMGGVA